MNKILKNLLIFLTCWISVAIALYGGTTGKIAGKVVDETTNETLPGVNIFIEGTHWGAASNLKGEYFIINIPPGVYTLRATMMGYEQMSVTNVRVSIDMTTKINFNLHSEVLDLGKEVVVTAEKPLVQKDATAQMAAIDGSTIAEKLPVTDINDVLAMQAGFSKDQQGKLHVRGGRFGEITYMVDGVYVSDPFVDPFSFKFGGTATSPDAKY